MLIVGSNRMSQLKVCLDAAPLFQLSTQQGEAIIARQIAAIRDNWDAVCGEAQLEETDRKYLWRRQFLNPFAFEGLTGSLAAEDRH
jgi:serine/threonine-protein kinase HipA